MANTEWKQTDAGALREFLSKNPRFKEVLKSLMPRSGNAKTTEEAATSGQRTEGFLQCLDEIDNLAYPEARVSAERPFLAEPKSAAI